MSASQSLLTKGLLLDACCAITLFHSGKMEEILMAACENAAITSYVYEHELDTVNLTPLVNTGRIAVLAPVNDLEMAMIVDLAYELDDGEAHTGAIAVCRGWAIATDDSKAIRRLKRRDSSLSLSLFTTPDLINHWAMGTSVTEAELQAILTQISGQAKYRPAVTHPLRRWWDAHT